MRYPTAWVRDGALRDIYVFESDLDEWQKVLNFVRRAYPFTYRVDDVDTPLPVSIGTIFQDRSEHTHLLAVQAGDVSIHCHFFLEDEIEFDVNPREIESEAEEDEVVKFMRGIGDALGRQVVLTMEGAPDWVYLRIEPGQEEPEYTPVEVERGPTMSGDEALSWMAKQLGLDENDQEGVFQSLIDSANRPHTAHHPKDPQDKP
jgi:hypothetical protein